MAEPRPSTGVVRLWNHDEGWGVIDSPDTPGGCWIHTTTTSTRRHAGLEPGRGVRFTFERLPGQGVQDGYDYVARDAWYVGDEPHRRPPAAPGAYRTALTITWDDGQVTDSPEPIVAPMEGGSWLRRAGTMDVWGDMACVWVGKNVRAL